MSPFKITKLTRKHKGCGPFTHRIEIGEVKNLRTYRIIKKDFIVIRTWFIKNFGTGVEIESLKDEVYHRDTKPKWAFDTGTGQSRLFHIYLGKSELTWFLVTQPNFQ